jgi:ABC-type multidrug transport system fused ATPase/permease subunit
LSKRDLVKRIKVQLHKLSQLCQRDSHVFAAQRISRMWSSNVLEYSEYLHGQLCFQNLELGQNLMLSGKISPNQCVVMVNAEPAVKINLFKKLLRSSDVEVDMGTIMLDGYDVNVVPRSQLRQKIRILTADPPIFPVSILENVLLGDVDISRFEVQLLFKRFGILEFVYSLRKGFDTRLLPSRVSKNMKLAIGLARALLWRPKILIFGQCFVNDKIHHHCY